VIFRCIWYINGSADGWSEETYLQIPGAGITPAAAAAVVEILLSKRAACMGKPYQIVAYRVTAYTQDDGSAPTTRKRYFKRPNPPFGPPGSNPPGAEPGNVGAELQMFNSDGSAEARVTLGGPPDDAVKDGGVIDLSGANFGNNANAYIAYLQNPVPLPPGVASASFGWGAVGPPAKIDLSAATITLTNSHWVLSNLVVPAFFEDGIFYPARISRVNRGKSILNRAWLAMPTGGGTVVTCKELVAFGPSNLQGATLSMYQQFRLFTPFGQGGLIAPFSVKHHRGKPFGQFRGRRAAQVLS